MQYDLFTPVEIKSAIEGLKDNKASGTDNVFAEHLKYAVLSENSRTAWFSTKYNY